MDFTPIKRAGLRLSLRVKGLSCGRVKRREGVFWVVFAGEEVRTDAKSGSGAFSEHFQACLLTP